MKLVCTSPLCREVVLARNPGASGIFPVGAALRNPAVEYNVVAFSELSFAARSVFFRAFRGGNFPPKVLNFPPKH